MTLVIASIDSVLCYRDDGMRRVFPLIRERLLSIVDDGRLIFVENAGGYSYRLMLEEMELQGRSWNGRRDFTAYPSSSQQLRDEIEQILFETMGEKWPYLLAFNWWKEGRDGTIVEGGLMPQDEMIDPAWSIDWRLPRTGMIEEAMRVYDSTPDATIFVTAKRDAIQAAGVMGINVLHPLEL